MIIGVDFDDILGECAQAMIDWHNQVYGTSNKIKDIITFDLEHVWKTTYEERIKRCEEFLHSKYCGEMNVVNGALDGIDKLSKKHKLIIITARLNAVSEVTQKWIDKYFPNIFEKICYNEDWKNIGPQGSKLQMCKDNKVDMLIDDNLDTAKKVSAGNIPVLLLDYPWNQSDELPDKVTRVKRWEEIVDSIDSKTF
ncbi:hypothetical protein HN924_03215 [Candidatus Woesearchaeota archaeon]|jgi:uncharacterized HAD superfamily protein|nr:hypothetical protein [Candidatus Woesearchaeota archaeon]MBT7062951.1 hypothetical protein [Candidatus Woesearchaeota archaeon]MBT7402567.1 hypothetical protein [Candidatus Woesearchaeota archaeon]